MKRIKGMRKRFLLWIGAATLLITVGCAKAPVEDAAAKKNTEQLVEKALSEANAADSEALYQRVGAPKSYAEEIPVSSDRMRVSMDAEVILPALSKIGIYAVSASGITQEFAETAYQYFCGAVDMYPESSSFTRDWYETEIARMQKNLADQTLDASARENAEGYLALLEQELEAAPTSLGEPVEHVQFYTQQAEGNGQYTCFQATQRAFPERGKRFSVTNDTVYTTDAVSYQVDGWKTVAPRSDAILEYRDTSVYQGDFSNVREISDEEQAENISITPSAAKAQAQKVLDDLGLADMRVGASYTVNNAMEAVAMGVDTQYAYCVTAYRTVSQIPVRAAGYASYVGSAEDGHEWVYEKIFIGVNDQGVFHFSWRAPLAVGNMQVADSNLLAFDEILKVFRATIAPAYSATVQALSADATLIMSVDRIELSLQRISKQGSVMDGILCPVWSFWGKTRLAYASGAVADWGESPIEINDLLYPLLSINAVDGSILIANEGY